MSIINLMHFFTLDYLRFQPEIVTTLFKGSKIAVDAAPSFFFLLSLTENISPFSSK